MILSNNSARTNQPPRPRRSRDSKQVNRCDQSESVYNRWNNSIKSIVASRTGLKNRWCPAEHSMSWFSKIFKSESSENANSAEDVVRFYQQLGFFTGVDPAGVVQRYTDNHGKPPRADRPWDDVFLLAYSENDVWSQDPEADVCAENKVYSGVISEWAGISCGAFAPIDIAEHWESETGPVTLSFRLNGQLVSVSPRYQDDWIDLDVLQQINALIAHSGRQFECAVDCNFALVLCLTREQKRTMQKQRRFPFAW